MTLIEIMIVVAIIGLLAAIATPSYTTYLTKQRRADAHHLLQANAQMLQRCLTLVGSYDGDCNTINTSKDGHYDLTSNSGAQTWTLTAKPVSDGKQQKDVDCTSFILTHTGQKSATGKKPGSCW